MTKHLSVLSLTQTINSMKHLLLFCQCVVAYFLMTVLVVSPCQVDYLLSLVSSLVSDQEDQPSEPVSRTIIDQMQTSPFNL